MLTISARGLKGQLSGASVTGALGGAARLAGTLSGATGAQPYTGAYEVTPTAHEQSLGTQGRLMRQDVTVHQVPYYETSNESGGFTVSILS